MKTTLVGLLLNLLFTLALMGGIFTDYDTDFASSFGTVLLGLWGLSVLGFVLAMAGSRKWGSILVIVGSIVFIPLGIVAMIGARKLREADANDDLEARRKLNSQH
ncbi:hypothetical protein [Halomonas binhaiensis]|uniref:Uncharacterized protein n=1 Tax=Halomonas binhaiensis TaxID=2562282 RepID=A0A5C1NH64_9GAMM|nr:hypothetical protein [Halomonas binhaiensis]QEM81537.1 hypothetical protein E4T21_08255 [Halomonas binhaiensis]